MKPCNVLGVDHCCSCSTMETQKQTTRLLKKRKIKKCAENCWCGLDLKFFFFYIYFQQNRVGQGIIPMHMCKVLCLCVHVCPMYWTLFVAGWQKQPVSEVTNFSLHNTGDTEAARQDTSKQYILTCVEGHLLSQGKP